MSSDLRANLKGCVDKILGLRDDIGAKLHNVYMVTRTWSGEDLGDGTETDTEVQILPSPQIVDYGMDVRLQTGSSVRQGDLILKGISCNKYTLSGLHTQTEVANSEKFYKINSELYEVIHIKEKFLTFEVHLRKVSTPDRRII